MSPNVRVTMMEYEQNGEQPGYRVGRVMSEEAINSGTEIVWETLTNPEFLAKAHEVVTELMMLPRTTTFGGNEDDATEAYIKFGASHVHITEDDPMYNEYWDHVAGFTNACVLKVITDNVSHGTRRSSWVYDALADPEDVR
jgi:ligand-binding SRPBCC domain-containing protein